MITTKSTLSLSVKSESLIYGRTKSGVRMTLNADGINS